MPRASFVLPLRVQVSASRLVPALLLLAGVALPIAARAQADPGPVPVGAIDSVFADMNGTDRPGCAVGIVRDGRLEFAKGYGMADLERRVALAPTSVFRTGSVSKQFTAAAIVLLAQDGVIALDDPVRRWIPELPDYGPGFTIRRLLHHTSGVRDYLVLTALAGYRNDDYYTDDDVVELLARQPETNFEPGVEFLYSNSGYFLLSQIVKRATGGTLAEYAQERIFARLGMTHTHFHDDHTRVVPDRALGYAPGDDGWRISMTTLPMIGDGGVFTSVQDLAAWDRNFDDPVVGGPALVETILTPGVLNDDDTLDYAMGLGHGEHRGLPIVAHGGAFVGYRAASLRYPDHGVSVYTLCNRADVNPSSLSRRVGEALLGDVMEPEEAGPDTAEGPGERVDTLEVGAAELRPYGGTYYSEVVDANYRVVLDGDTLRLEVGNWLDGPMAPVGEDEFRRGLLRMEFTRDADGRIDGFLVDAGRVRGIRFERR